MSVYLTAAATGPRNAHFRRDLYSHSTRAKWKYGPMWVLCIESSFIFLFFQNANEALYAPRHHSSYLSVMHQNDHILANIGKHYELNDSAVGYAYRPLKRQEMIL